MNSTDQEVSELLDRDRIRECLARLARGEDRRNTELITGSYWPQATIDYGIFTGTFEDYLAWVIPGSPEIAVTQHMLGQSVIELYTDTALVETQVLAHHRVVSDSGHTDTVIGGRYLDWMDKIGGQWRISQRTMVYDWVQDLGPSVDWTTGLMGIPLSTARYTGRTVDDCSERFFGDCWTSSVESAAE